MKTIKYQETKPIPNTYSVPEPTNVIDSSYFNENSQIYIVSNDQINSITENIVKPGNNVLTVASSGDYLLDCVLHGAKEITNYDINPFQYYAICLKLWALQTLDYEDYISFFTDQTSKNFFSSETLTKIIKPFKNESAYNYWQTFIKHRKEEEKLTDEILNQGISKHLEIRLFLLKDIMQSDNPNIEGDITALYKNLISIREGCSCNSPKFKAFRTLHLPKVDFKIIGHLSSKQNYHLTRQNIKDTNLSFMVCSLSELESRISTNYDNIFLSNIPFYITAKELINSINDLYPHLNNNGTISYYYHCFKKDWFTQFLQNPYFTPEEIIDSPLYQKGTKEALEAYKFLIENGYNIITEELETSSTINTEIDVNHDVKCLIRKV